MLLNVIIYEDSKFTQFGPVTGLRPAFLLRAGIFPLFDLTRRAFPEASVSFATRDSISPLVAKQVQDIPVNIVSRADDENSNVLFVNGRIKELGDLVAQVEKSRLSTVYMSSDGIAAVLLKAESVRSLPKLATPIDYLQRFNSERKDIPDFECSARLYSHPWEIVTDIKSSISRDFELLRDQAEQLHRGQIDPKAVVVNPEDIILEVGSTVSGGAVLDASHGPIYIDANTRVEAQAAIYGPTYIGPNSVVVAGKIEGCSIGHTCRVGGEIEASVFQEYVNKYHAGFIGHSYVGAWVNFGAMTTNSDLKNNYSNIRVTIGGQSLDTGLIKVGSLIGDHTKFGIGTHLNTGINLGVCCNIFGSGLIADREVPSYRWGGSGGYVEYRFDKALETMRRSMARRNYTLSAQEERVLQEIFSGNQLNEGVIDFA